MWDVMIVTLVLTGGDLLFGIETDLGTLLGQHGLDPMEISRRRDTPLSFSSDDNPLFTAGTLFKLPGELREKSDVDVSKGRSFNIADGYSSSAGNDPKICVTEECFQAGILHQSGKNRADSRTLSMTKQGKKKRERKKKISNSIGVYSLWRL
jgi:hypothetical protein